MLNTAVKPLTPHLNAQSDIHFIKPWRLFNRIGYYFQELHVLNLTDEKYLFFIEQFLLKNPQIKQLTVSGNMTHHRILGRLSRIATRCRSLRKITLIHTQLMGALPLTAIWNWTEALKQIQHRLHVRFENCVHLAEKIRLFQHYLSSATKFELLQINELTLEISPARSPLSETVPYTHFKQLKHILGLGGATFVTSFKPIKKFQGNRDRLHEFCDNFFIKMSVSCHQSGLLQLIARIEDHVGISLGRVPLVSQSGQSFSVSAFAFEKLCYTAVESFTQNLSLYSAEALQEFAYAINHGGEFWNLTGSNMLELLSIAIQAQSPILIRSILSNFRDYYSARLAELALALEISQPDPFLSSYQYNEELFDFHRQPDVNFHGFFLFLYHLKMGAFEVVCGNLVNTIHIKKQLKGVPLQHALEFAFSTLNLNSIHLNWEGSLQIDWMLFDAILIAKSSPKLIQVNFKTPLTLQSPLVDFLKKSENIRALALCKSFGRQLTDIQTPNGYIIKIATEVIRSSTGLKSVKLNQLFYAAADLERLGSVVAESTSLKRIFFDSTVTNLETYRRREEARTDWSGFFKRIEHSSSLAKLEVKPILNLKNVLLQKSICSLVRETRSLNEITLAVESISVSFVRELVAAVTFAELVGHGQLKKVTLSETSTFDEDVRFEIYELLRKNKQNSAISLVVVF